MLECQILEFTVYVERNLKGNYDKKPSLLH